MGEFIPVCAPVMWGNEKKYVNQALDSGWISSTGEYVKRFEDDFAAYCGVKFATSTPNGTQAIHLMLVAAGVKKGDEVILPNFTMAGSLFPILYCGAKPVFVDIEADTYNIDPKKIEEKITSKTKVIMPVHIFGHPVDMTPIQAIAEKYKLMLLEDAAESHGALYFGKKAGGIGLSGAFSFFANKVIATGEGGMVVTDDKDFYDRLCYFKNLCFKHNGPRDYWHEDTGFNYRFNNLQAAIGVAQLEKIEDYIQARRINGAFYLEHLNNIKGITLQSERSNCRSVYWMNSVLIDPKIHKKTIYQIMADLKAEGIETRELFKPMHQQGCLKKEGWSYEGQQYPVTENLSKNGLYLPSGSGLTHSDRERVVLAFSRSLKTV